MQNRRPFLKPVNVHVLLASLLLGVVGALLLGIANSLKTAENSLRADLKVAIFIANNLPDPQAEAWSQSLPARDHEIESATFISRSEALQKAQANTALAKSLMLLHDNPLPASVVIRY